MAASYDQSPGTLNLSFQKGNAFSALVDFSIAITGLVVTASLESLVTGEQVLPITTTVTSASNGQVNISLTASQTSALPRGTYGWSMKWVDGESPRTALTGIVEVQ